MTGIGTSNPAQMQSQSVQEQNSDWFTAIPSHLVQPTTLDSAVDFQNIGDNGIILEVILANKANSGSFTPQICTRDDAGNVLVLSNFTALTANGTKLYFVHPHADKTATVKNNFTEEGTLAVPRNWFVRMLANGNGTTDAFDVEVHACYVK